MTYYRATPAQKIAHREVLESKWVMAKEGSVAQSLAAIHPPAGACRNNCAGLSFLPVGEVGHPA
jgi:hypothetical protein